MTYSMDCSNTGCNLLMFLVLQVVEVAEAVEEPVVPVLLEEEEGK